MYYMSYRNNIANTERMEERKHRKNYGSSIKGIVSKIPAKVFLYKYKEKSIWIIKKYYNF